MAQARNVLNGSVIYDKVFPLLDYCGDIARNGSVNSSNVYSPNYSPNNIKRLIISPNVVEAHYHVPLPEGGRIKRVSLSPLVLQRVQELVDYKPIMKILCTERICSSVEEVILLSRSNDGQVYLSSRELDFQGLINNYRNNQGDIKMVIMNRYKRLRAFVVSDMSYNEFMQGLGKAQGTRYDFISELPFMQNSTKELFHTEEDYFEHWGSAGQTYTMDKVGGKLHTYFTDLVKSRKESAKRSAVDAMVKERNKGLIGEVTTLYNRYKLLDKAQSIVYGVLRDCANNLYTKNPLITWIAQPKLYKCSVLSEGYPKIDTSLSETDALRENKKILEHTINLVATSLSHALIVSVNDVVTVAPLTARVLLKGSESTVVVPSGDIDMVENIARITGVRYEAKDIKASIINSCWLLCLFFADRTANNANITKYVDKEFWKGVLK